MDRAQLRRVLLAPLTAALLVGAFSAPASAALSADSMFEPTTVVAIDLQLPPASVTALEADPDEYVEGTFALAESDGTPQGIGEYTAPLTVGIRLKGSAGSFRNLSAKAAFKVKFNEFVKGQKFLGLKKLTLNNMVQDASMIHEALVYPAYRAAGIPAPHAGYAYVHLNGVDYGLHLNLETIDDVALEKRFGEFDDPQHLYEGVPSFDVKAGDLDEFEIDEGDEDDISDLEALAAAAAAETPGFSARMAPVADLAEMTRFWAAERYLGQWDGYSGIAFNNYYLYSDQDGVFQMLPWGADQMLRNWWYAFSGQGGLLFAQCLAEAACFDAYKQDLIAVEQSTTALDLGPRAEALAAQLAPWQAMEIAESERAPYDADEIEAEVEGVLEFLERRPGLLAKWLDTGEHPPPEPEPKADEPVVDPKIKGPPPPREEATISGRLEIDRSQLGRGTLIARPTVASDGTISVSGTIGPPGARRPACLAETITVRAGTIVIRCRLTDSVRKRLVARVLNLRLAIGHAPSGGGAPHTVTRSVRLPRQALR